MKVSVITINYNNCFGLRHTIESVVNQTYKNFEYIVIDGGSTDGSIDVIKKYADRIDYWQSEPDKGIYNAMNKGVVQANGEYCIFMNAGDLFIDNNVLNEVYHQLDGTDIVYGNTEYTTGENRESKNEPPNFRFLYVSSFSHQSTFIRTKLLKLTPYDESLKIVADWKFFLQSLIMENRTFKSIDVKISLYDVTGISSTNKSLYEIERDQVLLSLIPRWMLEDYHKLIYGESWEERLFIEIRNSRYVSFFYSVNVCLIRMLAIFKKGSNWIKKYPIKLNKKKR